ncbi:YczE/YyaS/YitT family protein [Domibacillus epiphyticus]|uniref:BCR, YitT family protein n=1 Tax=Domibacillus epiphyticus TaxID=1714355 RepID=A0A1V2A4V0_9BACI|nr:DUF6198 family protein [Domibacillus epiphyticus]OMP66041.1 BCR, YitT family protein [Domibacillus epiphyticus]
MGRRIAVYFAGLAITALGIALVVHSAAGAGPWDAVAVGLKLHFGLTIGMWSIIAQGCVVAITAMIDRTRFQFESIFAIILRSWLLDFWFYVVLKDIDFTSSVSIQWFTFGLGVLTVGLGIGIYVEANLPKTPLDGLMIALNNVFGWSFSTARMVIELSGAAIGFFLGGPVGVGTVIIALTLGRIISIVNRCVKKFIVIHDVSI